MGLMLVKLWDRDTVEELRCDDQRSPWGQALSRVAGGAKM